MHPFSSANISDTFTRCCLHSNALDWQTAQACNVLAHGLLERQDLGTLQHQRTIDVHDVAVLFLHQCNGMFHEGGTRSPLPSRVRIREVLSDVTKSQGSQQRINECMEHHITVTVSNGAKGRGDINPSEDERLTFCKAVHVESKTYHVANLRVMRNDDLCNMTEQPVSVSELTYAIKGLLEEGIGDVMVSGEISNFKHHSSGHRYFTLKDADAQIGAVMWRSRTLTFRPEDGMRVVVRGKLTVYSAQGKYQIDCSAMRPEGLGDLHMAFEKLKESLRARGYFDESNKRPLPRRPRSVGIATSATGAALQDMLSTINYRFPLLDVVFRPTLVQGDGASEDIAKAIRELDRAGLDVIIIGRGGGSMEDLWCFNTEAVADAIYNAETPIISAVGHETDFTIADFVADRRAETPTAAAVIVTPITAEDLLIAIDDLRSTIVRIMTDNVIDLREIAESFVDGRAARRITERVLQRSQRIDDLTSRFARTITHRITMTRQRIDHVIALSTSLHPLAPLKRGYAVVERDGHVLTGADTLKAGDRVHLQRQTERSAVRVEETTPTTPIPSDEHHG